MQKYKNRGGKNSDKSSNSIYNSSNGFKNQQKPIVLQIQDSIFSFYHNLLDNQVFTPVFYAFLVMIAFLQQIHFVLGDLSIVDDEQKREIITFNNLLKYLTIFPSVKTSGHKIAYMFFFFFLIILQMMFVALLLFNFLFSEERETSKKITNVVKKQVSNTYKIALKSASFYLILQRELLMIPSLYFSIDILVCNSVSDQDDQKLHEGTDIECWSTIYIILVIFGVLHLFLLFTQYVFQILYTNDSFQDDSVPWSQSTLKPQILSITINLAYIIWFVLDGRSQFKVIIDIFCLLVSILVIIFRFMYPTFASHLVMKAIIISETGRLWFSLCKIMHQFFDVQINQFSFMMELLIVVFLSILIIKLLQYRINQILFQGFKSIENSLQLEIYLSSMYKIIQQDEKMPNFLLQGILQLHFQECLDKECPCYINMYEDQFSTPVNNKIKIKSFSQQLKESNHDNKQLMNYQSLDRNIQNIRDKMKPENYFIDLFQLRKATDIENKLKRGSIHEDYSSHDMDVKRTFTPQVWYDFLRYQLRTSIKNFKLNVEYHYTLSGFYFLKIRNEFQSLFELIQAQERKPNLHQKFLIYRHKKRIEKVIFSKHEKSSQMSRRLNILSVYEYEKNFSLFQKLITKNTSYCMKFWNELLEKDINVVRMHELGIQISKNHQSITMAANKLLQIYPNQLVMILNYSKYLNDVINNEFNAVDYFQMALQQRINLKQKLKMLNNNDNEDILFGENSFCSIFVLKTEGKTLGLIEYVNEEIQNLLGYTPNELTGKDINTIIPRMIARVHENLLLKFFEKAESSVLNKVRELFAKDKEGYLVPIYLFSKVLPTLTSGLKLIGVIKRIQYLTFEPECPSDFSKIPQEYIICDQDNNIQNFSYGMTTNFGLFPKMFISTNGNSLFDQEVNIDYLSSDFLDKQADLQQTGAIISINTNRLFEKVDREVLSNEEFNYFIDKQQETKVFCQMIEMSFQKLVSIKLYRLIQFTKFQFSQKQLTISISRDTDDDINNGSSFNIQSASAASSTTSTMMNMDRQLKDFKKQITDNIEPKIVLYIRRIMQVLLVLIGLLASLSFIFHVEADKDLFLQVDKTLKVVQLYNKFIQTQNNLRSMLNIPNNVEYGFDNMTLLPYPDSRFKYVNTINNDLIEQIRVLTNQLSQSNKMLDDVVIYEVDSKGKFYNYSMNFDHALNQFIVRSLELQNRNLSTLKMPVIDWKLASNKSFVNLNVFVSSYFVVNSGYKTLTQILYKHMSLFLKDLSSYNSNYFHSVLWLSVVSILILLFAQGTMVAVIQIVENNKVRVLSLYSEIKIEDAQESLTKCKRFYNYLQNIKVENDLIVNNQSGVYGTEIMSDIFNMPNRDYEDLDVQWNRFVNRLNVFRVNTQKQSIEKLKKKFNDESAHSAKKSLLPRRDIQSDSLQDQIQNQVIVEDFQDDSIAIDVSKNSKILGMYKSRYEQEEDKNQDQESNMNKNQIIVQHQKNLNRRQSKLIHHAVPQTLKSLATNTNTQKTTQSLKIKKKSRKIRDEDDEDIMERSEASSVNDSEEDHNTKRKSKKPVEDAKKETEQDITRIGKHEQFSKIKSRNWKQVIFVVVQTLLLLGFFIFEIFYLQITTNQVQESSRHIKASYMRQAEMNALFGYFRERLITGTSYVDNIEQISVQRFYENENNLSKYQNDHSPFIDFLYKFISKIDSKEFCSTLELQYNLTNCQVFRNGILQQGFKSAMFTFMNYYTQLNITKTSTLKNMSMDVLNSQEIQSFLIVSESYFVCMIQSLDILWKTNMERISQSVHDIVQAIFIIFLVLFFFSQLIITPKIINQLNETTWRSRGILNLVPNNIFKEMKQNSRIFKMLKT